MGETRRKLTPIEKMVGENFKKKCRIICTDNRLR